MNIAIAQIRPSSGNVPVNIEAHLKFIDLAITLGADALFFPELSLTGYEPPMAQVLAINDSDSIFDVFQTVSNKYKVIIGLGMPTIASIGIQISMLIFQPNQPFQIYSKQQLHPDELPYFVGGDQQVTFHVNNIKIAPAICYESLQLDHAYKVNRLGADIYVASVAKSQNGLEKAMTHYRNVAKEYSMTVLMSNCVEYCDNFQSVGQRAIWTDQGELVAQLDDQEEGILIIDTDTQEVIKRSINRM